MSERPSRTSVIQRPSRVSVGQRPGMPNAAQHGRPSRVSQVDHPAGLTQNGRPSRMSEVSHPAGSQDSHGSHGKRESQTEPPFRKRSQFRMSRDHKISVGSRYGGYGVPGYMRGIGVRSDDRSIMSYRSSDMTFDHMAPPKLENTYKMEPDKNFPPCKVERIIKDVLERELCAVDYSGSSMGRKAQSLAETIKDNVKTLKLDRFKIISWVTICEKNANNMRVASRSLWDEQTDSYATATYENDTLYALGIVYATYLE